MSDQCCHLVLRLKVFKSELYVNTLVWRASMWSVVMISPHQDCTIQVGVQTCDIQLLDMCWVVTNINSNLKKKTYKFTNAILKFTSQHHALCPFVFGLKAKILKHTDHSSSNKPVSQNLSGVSKTSGTNPRRPVIWLEGPYSTVPGRFILPLFRRGMRDTLQCSAVLLSFIVTFLHSFSLSSY